MNFGGYIVVDIAGLSLPSPKFSSRQRSPNVTTRMPSRIHRHRHEAATGRQGLLLRYLEILLLRASRRARADASVYFIGGPALAIRRNASSETSPIQEGSTIIADQVSGNTSRSYRGGLQYREPMAVDARFPKGCGMSPCAVSHGSETSAFAVLLGVRL